tara:strand:+ start:3109 stop:4764 length:1656 start_codon:yes stop_codon:yes gene_type:complete
MRMIPDGSFLFSNNDVEECTHSRFYGYGVSKNALIFGTSGLQKYLDENNSAEWPSEGRFAGIFVEEERILIKTDNTGQELLYFFQKEDDWAVSNSFFLLLSYAKSLHELKFLPHIASCFHLKKGQHIGEQLISHKTMVDEITIVPITWQLIVNRESKEIQFEKSDYLEKYTTVNEENYNETVIEVLQNGAGLLKALSDNGHPLNPHISGGYDSRLVLCMIAIAGVSDNINVSSYRHKTNDYNSAVALCEHFGLPLNLTRMRQESVLSAGEALRVYLMSCGGTYLPFYPIHDIVMRSPFEVVLTGDQPTGWSHFAGTAQFNGNADKIANDILEFFDSSTIGKKLSDEFLSTFDLLGIDKNHPAAMLAHYTAIRSRHHCGRNWYKSMGSRLLFTPLMDSRFIALDLYNQKNGIHPTQLFIDTFSATGDWACEIPFETPERSFTEEQRRASPFYGGVDLKPTKFRLYGNPATTEDERSDSMFDIEIRVGYNLEIMRKTITRQYYASKLAKSSGIFSEEDLQMINAEIESEGTLSHGYRKLMHLIFVDLVLKTIQ